MQMNLRELAICGSAWVLRYPCIMQPLPPKRPRVVAQCVVIDMHIASFWYVRANQPPVSLRLHTQETGEQRVAYDGRRLHGNWEYTENQGVKTFTVEFNANPDHRPRVHTFTQIGNTEVYRHVGNTAEWTVMLIYLPSESW